MGTVLVSFSTSACVELYFVAKTSLLFLLDVTYPFQHLRSLIFAVRDARYRSYSTRDGLMGFSRIAVAVSLVFSYPLAFVGARDGVLELFKVKNRSSGVLNTLTVGMLSAITVAALLIPDVSFVLAFAG